jgi:CPA1 family monovalent cation:H+ antiporter
VQDLPLVDNSISLLTPFAAYVPADALGGSGVLAVVAAGLYIGQHLATMLSPVARVQTGGNWEMVAFILENLVFVLIGLELPHLIHETQPRSLADWLGFGAAISLVVILVRLVMVLPSPFLWRAVTRSRAGRPDLRKVALVGWMGVRGADSVVIALALPQLTAAGAPFPARGLIVFITFGVVFTTLVLQGLTIGPLTRRLGLQGDTVPEQEEAHARHVVASAGLERLEHLADSGGNSTEIVDTLRRRHRRRARRWETRERHLGSRPIGRHDPSPEADAGDEAHASSYRRLRGAMLDAERRAVVDLRDRGVIGADVLRRIERDLDLEVMLLDEAPRSGEHPGASAAPSHE